MRPPTVGLQLIDVLREFGVNAIFGIPGGTVSPLYAALMDRPDVKVITSKHETGAVFMALGYSVATGRPGVVFTIAGPGITNALTGLASAYYEGVPVILIAGEVPRAAFGRGALQEGSASAIDSVALARRITKFSAQISRPGSAAALTRKALTTAFSGRRGPAFLSVPLDVSNELAPAQPIAGRVQSSFEIDSAECRNAVDLLASSERPLILCGAGARDGTSRRAVRRLAESLGVPVAVTTKGKGVFPEDHPLYLGMFGFGGHESVTEYLKNQVDVLLVCGSSLGDIATNAWSPLLRASRSFIQIDVDAAQLGRNYPINLGLLGPIDAVVARMMEHHRSERPLRRAIEWEGPRYQPPEPSPSGKLTPSDVVLTLNRLAPPGSVFTSDIGEHLAPTLHYLQVKAGGDFLACIGFSSMGSGICSAIGYQLGAPSRSVYSICGDGGFLMYGCELATAVQYGIPITFVIMNDNRLNMVHHGMKDLYGATPDFSTQVIDFAAFAGSVGSQGCIVTNGKELEAALQRERKGPFVIDVRIDGEARLGGSQRNAALRQFKEAPNV